MTHQNDPFLSDDTQLSALNAVFVEEMYERWAENPSAVDASWQSFFAGFGDNPHAVRSAVGSASWAHDETRVIGEADETAQAKTNKAVKGGGTDIASTQESLRAIMMIRAYRVRGHLIADLDPLQQEPNKYHAELDPATYGFGPDNMDKPIFIDGVLGMETATMREILNLLRNTYCGKMGVEFMHIQYPEQKSWIQRRIESARGRPNIPAEEKTEILRKLVEVEAFEDFVHVKYTGSKRFSIQGGDTVISGLDRAIAQAAELGVKDVGIGMPHRGRLNVVTAVMGRPYVELLSIFNGNLDFPEWVESSGDVKYHLGLSTDRTYNGKNVHLSLSANPSHLEAVNPVVCGRTRAKLRQMGDIEAKKLAMPILMHGDAAFAGQGVVPESLSFAELKGYRSGGTLHIIVNNQIGFTTSPKNSRFTPYPSDVAKTVQAPIFHVNGDDPEAVAYVCKLAVDFRQEFGRDVVVDVFCYRRYGHNEGDEPMFTQPLMYKAIKLKKSPATIYAEQLIAESFITQEGVDGIFKEFKIQFEKDHDTAKNFSPNKAGWLEGEWQGLKKPDPNKSHPAGKTGMKIADLKKIGMKLTEVPSDFNLNSKIKRQMGTKVQMMETGENIDWAMGEALAFGSLVTEGTPVRISGQDSERGTFSHRHSVLTDQVNEDRYMPLNHIQKEQALFEPINSSLSEYAILGFEYGYSLAEPNGLTIWEAQFGDFVNGAQIMIDQFISSGEIKWLRMSGLVMLLPHGYEGQGPEHSSARLERFLQQCGEDNWQIVNITTPANYFHALRRQMHRDFRKPLIVMAPKSLLRHKLCQSTLADFGPKETFQRVIPEVDKMDDKKVKRVIFTSGKVYYDLYQAREERKQKDVAIVRVEQYYPFPHAEIQDVMQGYLKANKDVEVMWAQEEPENMGAWRFIGPRMGDVLDELDQECCKIKYAGRPEAASPAAGYVSIHNRQQDLLINDALTLGKSSRQRGKKAKAA
ncbi:MAG: 2-oxoglutarate dehydrogenase E1 component [Rickettsiales bacterium]|nr:2-oxoglutarate dehydrogenase E1 component [Rickettsiales bacterium]